MKNLYIVEYIYLFNYFDKSTPEKNEDTRYKKDTNFDSSISKKLPRFGKNPQFTQNSRQKKTPFFNHSYEPSVVELTDLNQRHYRRSEVNSSTLYTRLTTD